ncbi:hypothetical protein cand_012740 [Cryptosporidium andersoni]|uniref:RING-CH-type domain-containing protein n=1 Tax=Cryptosporidium andersoni TaxID=117008 RepID=A0A1J4MH32_9CRYT|nr:hypothetical protein cand_012740 [Cryptosporidium andersoni]
MDHYVSINEEITNKQGDYCFICLEDSSNNELERCCTQCYAVVHKECWLKWNRSQRIAAIRSTVLGESIRETTLCTICRSGSVYIDEDDTLDFNWTFNHGLIRQFLYFVAGRVGSRSYLTQIGLNDHPLCDSKILAINGLILTIIFMCILHQDLSPSSKTVIGIILWTYTAMVIQLLLLAGIYRQQILRELCIPEPHLDDSLQDAQN